MIKLLFIPLVFVSLQARDNPFFPAKGEKEIPYSSNKVEVFKNFDKTSVTLPSSARVIKKVTIEYENLDATIDKRSVLLNNAIDWHKPFHISQNHPRPKIIQQTVKPLKSSKPTKTLKQKTNYKRVFSIKHIKFYTLNKNFKIVTKDEIIRDFLLVKPHRIVLDFKRDTDIKSYIKTFKNSVFSTIRVGNHKGYYRAVIELDGLYRYKLEKISSGYLIKLK